jgi:hypothetical protein
MMPQDRDIFAFPPELRKLQSVKDESKELNRDIVIEPIFRLKSHVVSAAFGGVAPIVEIQYLAPLSSAIALL